jgi:peroxiredoxin (alkyl hydroperoxide reductase subunit C)
MIEMPKKFIRKPAPKFESNAYFDGVKKISLDDYKGKYIVLFFYPYDFNK